MADAHANFAYSTVATAPSPATSGTTMTVTDGSVFPAAPFNCTVWGAGTQPTNTGVNATTAEVVRVTSKGTGNDWTIVRNTEAPSTPRTIVVGDQVAATITAKTLTDVDTNYVNSFANYIPTAGGTGLQTLAANYTNTAVTIGSLIVFPVTIPSPIRFNQLLVPQSLSYVSSTVGGTNTYYSHYGIFSMENQKLSLITSNSFSIGESENAASLTWNYPTTTATSGWGYGSFPAGNLSAINAQGSSYISGTRIVGLHFGTEMSLSGGNYWIGLMSMRSTAGTNSTFGLSHAGIIGQVINSLNQPGTVHGVNPIGFAAAGWDERAAATINAWLGRHLGGVLNTSVRYFLGSGIPNYISLAHLNNAGASFTMTILPAVSFVST